MTKLQRVIVILTAALIAIRIIWPVQYIPGGKALMSYWPQPVVYIPPVASRVVPCNKSPLESIDRVIDRALHCGNKTGGAVSVAGQASHYTFQFGPSDPTGPVAVGVTTLHVVGILVLGAAAFFLARR